MPKDLAQEVYLDNPRVIMCGGGPGTVPGKAVEQPDGSYKISGQTTFQSGCHQVEWAFMGCPVYENDEPGMDEATGMPKTKMFFVNKSKFEIVDTWDVAGLRGSGSHDVKVDGAVIEKKWLDVELMKLPAHYPNPVFCVPLRLSYNKAAVALGVGRGAMDAFVDLAQTKTPMMSASTLRDRPIAQYRLGEAARRPAACTTRASSASSATRTAAPRTGGWRIRSTRPSGSSTWATSPTSSSRARRPAASQPGIRLLHSSLRSDPAPSAPPALVCSASAASRPLRLRGRWKTRAGTPRLCVSRRVRIRLP